MRAEDEDWILHRSILAHGPCECPTGSPYREPPSRLYRTDSAPEPCGPGISRDWHFHRIMRMVHNASAGLGMADPLGEPMGPSGRVIWDQYKA